MTGFEPAASCSQSRRATNCATPGYFVILFGWSVFTQIKRATNCAIPGYSISVIIPRRGRKSKIFLSVVIPVVKAAFVPLSATEGNPVNAGVTRLCGVSPCPVPDSATALPNQARYQLRYTRIFNCCHYITARRKIKDISVCGHSCGQSRFCAVFGNRRKSSKRRCYKALRRFALPCSGYRHGTPKPPALPTALHPDMKFRNSRKIKFNTFFRNAQRFSALQFWGVCGML